MNLVDKRLHERDEIPDPRDILPIKEQSHDVEFRAVNGNTEDKPILCSECQQELRYHHMKGYSCGCEDPPGWLVKAAENGGNPEIE